MITHVAVWQVNFWSSGRSVSDYVQLDGRQRVRTAYLLLSVSEYLYLFISALYVHKCQIICSQTPKCVETESFDQKALCLVIDFEKFF